MSAAEARVFVGLTIAPGDESVVDLQVTPVKAGLSRARYDR